MAQDLEWAVVAATREYAGMFEVLLSPVHFSRSSTNLVRGSGTFQYHVQRTGRVRSNRGKCDARESGHVRHTSEADVVSLGSKVFRSFSAQASFLLKGATTLETFCLVLVQPSEDVCRETLRYFNHSYHNSLCENHPL